MASTLVPTAAEAGVAALSNDAIARSLDEVATLLEAQSANPFRIGAYREGARIIRRLDRPALEILDEEGLDGLTRLSGIGQSLAASIDELARTGRLAMLGRIRGEVQAENTLLSLPGIGTEMAQRIRDHLHVETLEDLEVAAYDGRLRQVPGMGAKRIRAIRDTLRARFGRHRPPAHRLVPREERPAPFVAELLEIDREYRERAERGNLPNIAPRRFNPTAAAWLPVLHTQRGLRHYTALYSNTAKAHRVGEIQDWVIICRDDNGGQGQWTVITSRYGPLRGRRVIRGREAECREYYRDAVTETQLFLLEAGE